ncbi:MAG: T9SS type A sorting domain-containing protein [Bacteroidia bacterium]|nr:T9SS type A sorting domain-containing protein [Bacteroidia bacterium]
MTKKLYGIIIIMGLFSLVSYAQWGNINSIANQEKLNFQKYSYRSQAQVLPNNYDLKYCRAYWTVDPAVKFISGHIFYRFYHTDSINSFHLELSDSLSIDSVLMNGNSIAYTHNNGIVAVTFNNYLDSNQNDSLIVYYHGTPPESGFGAFAAETHGPDSIPVMWTLSEPYGAKDWWPTKQDLNDKIDSIDIYVTAPVIYQAVANGKLISENINGNLKTSHWQHRHPIAAYLVAFALSNYSINTYQVPLSTGTLDLINYIYPEDVSYEQAALNDMKRHLMFFDSLFIPYPYINEKYGHAQFNWGGGMEHQTISFVGNFSYELTAHELAHQWFGDYVTCGSWQDLWLNEGFATYLTGLTYERYSPDLYWKIWKKNQVNFITSSPDGSVFVTDTLNDSRLFDARLTYSKGAMLLHMLRWKIGDDHFFNAIRNYLNNPAIKNNYARTTQLKAEFEQESMQNLDEFFNDWYWGEGYPTYEIDYSQNTSGLLSFSLFQTQSHPSVSFFEMPVPIKFANAFNDTTIVFNHLFTGQNFMVNLNFLVDTVIINPDDQIVCKVQNTVGLNQNKLSLNAVIFPNPVSTNLTIQEAALVNCSNINLIITSGQGKEIAIPAFNYNKQEGSLLMDLSNLAAGIYFVKLSTEKTLMNFKLIKQ